MKKINASINVSEVEVKILNQATAVVGKLLKIRSLINSIDDPQLRQDLNVMLTESLMEFVDFDYINSLEELHTSRT